MGVESVRYEIDEGGYVYVWGDGSDFSELEEYFFLLRELGIFRDHVRDHYDGGGIVVLKDLWVEEEYRGEGYGSSLLVDFLRDVRDRGWRHVYLVADVTEANEVDLVMWYEGYGFEEIEGAGGFMVVMYRRM